MKKILHVTIGIPAYNEEANIAHLIRALIAQSTKSYILDTIVVVSDGSSDRTEAIVRMLSEQDRRVICLADHKRRGISYRLQQLINRNKSDILFFMDGDTIPHDTRVIDHLLSAFDDTDVAIATVRLVPVPPKTVVERMLFEWRTVWAAITYTWKGGNNIYNFRGIGIAVRNKFARSIQGFDQTTGASSHLMYLSAIREKHKTAVVQSSIVHYRLPSTLSDYLLQLNRGQGDTEYLKKTFGDIYRKEMQIPKLHKYLRIIRQLLYNPFGTVIGLLFFILAPLTSHEPRFKGRKKTWESVRTTKVNISIQ